MLPAVGFQVLVVSEGVAEALLLALTPATKVIGVGVAVGVGVDVTVGVALAVGVAVATIVGVGVAPCVTVAVGVGVEMTVAVEVGVGPPCAMNFWRTLSVIICETELTWSWDPHGDLLLKP
jgi:hypothetical protein